MKKVLYSLLSLATLLTVASCAKELENGKAANGATADFTISATLGPQTKAFADGTTADKLYVGLYEIGEGPTYTWVADNHEAPATISALGATVTFNAALEYGKSYKAVLWAQKQGAPYAIDWATATMTATPTGDANLEARDAFFGTYETGAVNANIDLSQAPITLKRPFAQVNVLATNVEDPTAAITSSMTVAQAPTTLNLITKVTGDLADWSFTAAAIDEPAFGAYASTHTYIAMNYVLVNQLTPTTYNVTVSAQSGSQNKDIAVDGAPLRPNMRTNITGSFTGSTFDFVIGGLISPTVEQVATPTFTPAAGEYNAAQNVTIACETAGATIHYTTDGTDPTATSATYTAAIEVAATTTIKAIAVKDGMTDSEIATAAYTITAAAPAQVATPTFTPAAGEYTSTQNVTIACTTDGATIHYTTDGTDPTATSATYTAAIEVAATTTIKAIAVKDGMTDSEIATAAYTITAAAPAQVATPTFTPAAGEYTSTQNVTIACTTDGATIHYTTDGTDPTATSATYTAAIEVAATTTIKAIAVKDGMTDSEIASATYTITSGNTPDPVSISVYSDVAVVTGEGATQTATWTNGDITVSAVRNATGNTQFRSSDTDHTRFYTGWTVSISSAANTISSVEITCTENSYATALTGMDFTNGSDSANQKVVTVSSVSSATTSVTLTAQVRISSITVNYE